MGLSPDRKLDSLPLSLSVSLISLRLINSIKALLTSLLCDQPQNRIGNLNEEVNVLFQCFSLPPPRPLSPNIWKTIIWQFAVEATEAIPSVFPPLSSIQLFPPPLSAPLDSSSISFRSQKVFWVLRAPLGGFCWSVLLTVHLSPLVPLNRPPEND